MKYIICEKICLFICEVFFCPCQIILCPCYVICFCPFFYAQSLRLNSELENNSSDTWIIEYINYPTLDSNNISVMNLTEFNCIDCVNIAFAYPIDKKDTYLIIENILNEIIDSIIK